MGNVEEELHRDVTASPPWNRSAGRREDLCFYLQERIPKKIRA